MRNTPTAISGCAKNQPPAPPHEGRIARIDHIRKGTFETFWQDDPATLPDDPAADMWWTIWCFRDSADAVIETARRLRCRMAEPDTFLRFPDIIVVPVFAPKLIIEILLLGTLDVAEVSRRAGRGSVKRWSGSK